jgi:hypothetical protein
MSVARRTAAAAFLLAGAVVTTIPLTANATVGVVLRAPSGSVPHAPVALPTAIEQLPPYQPQTFCSPTVKPGTQALANLLTATYSGTAIVSLVRPCASDTSEHYDGRAIDWGVDHRNATQRAQGQAFLDWLFAPDAGGDSDAMVRRLGVMYVIWNHRIWGAYSGRWEPYKNCSGPTACHIDHMHISLDWSGAMKKTSFWTGVVTAPMDPPLQTLPVGQTVTTKVEVSPWHTPAPVYRLVKGGRYLVTVGGTYKYDGERHHRADAECSTTDGKQWFAQAAAEDNPKIGLLDLWLDDLHSWRPVTSNGHGCDTTNHSYQRTLKPTKNEPLKLSIDDPAGGWGTDGSLRVTVKRLA